MSRMGNGLTPSITRTARKKVPELAMARAALERFRQARPPGVYKPRYIATLFRDHHQVRPLYYIIIVSIVDN